MSTLKINVSGIQKLILGLLIFGVGGLSPITYFTPYSSHQVPPYFISILEASSRGHILSTLPAEVLELFKPRWSTQGLTWPHNSIAPLNFTQRFTHSFELSLKYGYPLPTTQGLLDLLFLVQLPFMALLSKHSAWLSPPDHPPRFCLSWG